jgi:hypothetical protein
MVEYFTIPELPDQQMFRCEVHRATLRVNACADMWRQANQQRECPERLDRCKGCQLGATHAGEGDISSCPITGTDICIRCNRGGMRLVRDEICVSCWNREREWRIGKNAKGQAPKLHPPLYPMSIRVLAGDEVVTVESQLCVDTRELVVKALRSNRKQVLFAFSGGEFV